MGALDGQDHCFPVTVQDTLSPVFKNRQQM